MALKWTDGERRCSDESSCVVSVANGRGRAGSNRVAVGAGLIGWLLGVVVRGGRLMVGSRWLWLFSCGGRASCNCNRSSGVGCRKLLGVGRLAGATVGRAELSRLLGEESGVGFWLMGAVPWGRGEGRVGALVALDSGRVASG